MMTACGYNVYFPRFCAFYDVVMLAAVVSYL